MFDPLNLQMIILQSESADMDQLREHVFAEEL